MKRTPLRRRTKLKAKRSTKRRVARKPKRPEGWDDPGYRAQVRTLICCAPGCLRKAQCAHHAGHEKGTGLKPPDSTCIPLCHDHHTGDNGWHQSNGFARDWSKERKKRWADAMVSETRAILQWPSRHPHTQVEPLCPF